MADTVSEKIAGNALLTIAGRVGMVLITLLTPMLVTWLVAQADDLDKLNTRTTVIEQQLKATGEQSDQQIEKLSEQIDRLQQQNTSILTAIARLETKLEQAQAQ